MASEECAAIQVFCSKAVRPKANRQQPLGGSVCLCVAQCGFGRRRMVKQE